MVCPNPHRISDIATPTRFSIGYLMCCMRLQLPLNVKHSSLVGTRTLMRPCGDLFGSPSDAAFASHTRLLGARAWLVNFSSLFPSDAAFAFARFCDPLPEVQHQLCLDNVLGLLSRSFSNDWVAILTRLSSPITYALGFRSSLQKFKMSIVRMDGLRFSQDFNNTEGLCLFSTSVGWSVCDSRSKAFQSHRNLPFFSLLQTYTLLRTLHRLSGDLSQSSSKEWFTILTRLSIHIEFSLHLPVFAVLSLTRRMLVCNSHGILHSPNRCFTPLPRFAVFSSKFSHLLRLPQEYYRDSEHAGDELN